MNIEQIRAITEVFWRHMAQDVKGGSVYVFPTDFKAGIRYRPN